MGTGCTIDGAEVVTSLSEAARDKGLDTAQMAITIGDESCLVDLMPTVGAETYDARDRIPVRDARGTVEADALRRDLTIGAMLLRIARSTSERADGALEYTLLDFYGGIDDVQTRIIRTPFPRARPLAEVWDEVVRSEREAVLAERLGLEVDTAAQDATLQVIWWAKVLREDPLRIVRLRPNRKHPLASMQLGTDTHTRSNLVFGPNSNSGACAPLRGIAGLSAPRVLLAGGPVCGGGGVAPGLELAETGRAAQAREKPCQVARFLPIGVSR